MPVASFVAHYCKQVGLDTTDLSVDVGFEQADEPTRLADLEVAINLPHADAGDRRAAIRRVAEHCPIHETVELHMAEIDFEIRDRAGLAAGTSA